MILGADTNIFENPVLVPDCFQLTLPLCREEVICFLTLYCLSTVSLLSNFLSLEFYLIFVSPTIKIHSIFVSPTTSAVYFNRHLSRTPKISDIWLLGTTNLSEIWLSGRPQWSEIGLLGTPKCSEISVLELNNLIFSFFLFACVTH